MQKNECVALILAGGQGSRLGVLTKKIAKPALSFGGKYRIIDFTLSNCTNSRINAVGVLTQYQPLILSSHIGIGTPWDLDRRNAGVSQLPPYATEGGREWYKGTANAIYQNMDFIEIYKPKYVLILSGDHIYKMDYSLMLTYHKEKNADATIAVIPVPWEDASRFGIMNTDQNGRILEFHEKPQKPKNNLASMGVYIFNWKILKKQLEEDEANKNSSHDFGKDIIPKMLDEKYKMCAYSFNGYWKDVGTIASLWEANMDLLSKEPKLDLYDKNLRIYSATDTYPPQFISNNTLVKKSLVSEGCRIFGKVYNSVISIGATIGAGSYIKDSIIMPNVKIGKNVIIDKAIIGEETVIDDNCIITCLEQDPAYSCIEYDISGIAVVGE